VLENRGVLQMTGWEKGGGRISLKMGGNVKFEPPSWVVGERKTMLGGGRKNGRLFVNRTNRGLTKYKGIGRGTVKYRTKKLEKSMEVSWWVFLPGKCILSGTSRGNSGGKPDH